MTSGVTGDSLDRYKRTDDLAEWTAAEHLREACRLLEGPDETINDWETARDDNVTTATAHASIAAALYAAKTWSNRPIRTVADLPLEAES